MMGRGTGAVGMAVATAVVRPAGSVGADPSAAAPWHHLTTCCCVCFRACPARRSATYSGLLLAAAQAQPKFVEGLERQLAAFVADSSAKRWVCWLELVGGPGVRLDLLRLLCLLRTLLLLPHSLPQPFALLLRVRRRESLSAMPREQRAVVHALAQQYGLVSPVPLGCRPLLILPAGSDYTPRRRSRCCSCHTRACCCPCRRPPPRLARSPPATSSCSKRRPPAFPHACCRGARTPGRGGEVAGAVLGRGSGAGACLLKIPTTQLRALGPAPLPACSVAPTVPAAEVAALLRESEGHPMRLVDIAMSVDVR